jgi:hypothetical protein
MLIVTPHHALLRLLYELQLNGKKRVKSLPITEISKVADAMEGLEIDAEVCDNLLLLEEEGFVKRMDNNWALTQVGALLAHDLKWKDKGIGEAISKFLSASMPAA